MNYKEWNDLIARRFFNGEMAGREVLIYVNKETIEQIGSAADADFEDFIKSIKVGPDWVKDEELCQKAYQSYQNWRGKELEYPPYIAYLAFFVSAATIGGDFDPKAYYPRFWELLCEPGRSGTPKDFNRMAELWEDLEKWSTEEKHEELGRFIARIRGKWVHVGRPLSQTLLSDDERKYLPIIFSEAELDPADSPSDGVIKRLLLNYGENNLERRTLRLLGTAQSDNIEIVNALIEFVLGELSVWDGTIPIIDQTPSILPSPKVTTPIQPFFAGLHICLDIERVSGRITSTLRLKTNRSFPDNGLDFEYDGQLFSCKETIPQNWSTKLVGGKTPRPFDAAMLDWSKGVKFEDKEKKWRATFKASLVRVFLPGEREGFSGWVESQHLERDCEFIVACHNRMVAIVQQWGISSCDKFERKSFEGLPDEWCIFEGKRAHDSCKDIDVLMLPNLLRIRLEGGIKFGRSNTYLKFGPPLIILEGGHGNERVTLNGSELKRENTSIPCWRLPVDSPAVLPLIIEVFRDEQYPLQRRVIKLEEPGLSQKLEDAPRRDCSGQIIKNDVFFPSARGAIVKGIDSTLGIFPKVLPTYMSDRVIFLGSKPGEIVDWPDEVLPENWLPIWALLKSGKDQWTVNFCGQSENVEIAIIPGQAIKNKRAIKRWKEAIWVRRKNIKEPEIPLIRVKWAKYKEAAKNV